MALLGNYSVLHKSPAKYLTGTVGFGDRSNFNKTGMMRNRSGNALWQYDAQPSGFFAGRAYFPPQKAGRIVSRSSLNINATASGAMGLPGVASADFSINATAAGGLIAGGVAVCTFSINATGDIAGLAAGQATASMQINASAGASAWAFGVANAVMQINASAHPFGRGYMQASTVDNTTLTAKTISAAVWAAISAENNVSGTMGAKLNSAASGGVDYGDMALAVRAELVAELARIDAAISSRSTIADIAAFAP